MQFGFERSWVLGFVYFCWSVKILWERMKKVVASWMLYRVETEV